MLKKLILTGLLGTCSLIYADLNVAVSILPQKTFVKEIGGDKVNVSLMVLPGNSPHMYEPKPSQMKEIANADIYFTIDVEFEKVWLPKLASTNSKMKIIDLDEGIDKIEMTEHHEDEHEKEHKEHAKHDHDEHDKHEKEHHHEGLDPHIWTSPSNVKIIAKNIYETLVNEDKENKDYYKANYEKFLVKINETDKEIKKVLIDVPTGTKFLVFHPAWGYFAKDYGLIQLSIEVEGKEPKPKQVSHLIEEAKEEDVKAIFTAPEFSDKVAKQIAKEVGVPVLKISPLNPNWSENLINLAKAISNK